MSPYEMIDTVIDELGASKIADYLWMNYPVVANDIIEEIEARYYLAAMETSKDKFNAKEEDNG